MLTYEEIQAIRALMTSIDISRDARHMSDIYIARHVAFGLLNIPYIWGGDNPLVGMDCSGVVIEILKSVGKLPTKGDWTAEGLYNYFTPQRIETDMINEGCLIFWKNAQGVANHVEYAITPDLSLGARGSRRVTDTSKAIALDAYIKIRPWKDRVGRRVKGAVNPFI